MVFVPGNPLQLSLIFVRRSSLGQAPASPISIKHVEQMLEYQQAWQMPAL
jgi:hypothetical protein